VWGGCGGEGRGRGREGAGGPEGPNRVPEAGMGRGYTTARTYVFTCFEDVQVETHMSQSATTLHKYVYAPHRKDECLPSQEKPITMGIIALQRSRIMHHRTWPAHHHGHIRPYALICYS